MTALKKNKYTIILGALLTVGVINLLINSSIDEAILGLLVLITFLMLLRRFIKKMKNKQPNKKVLPTVSKEKNDHYQAEGMTEQEIQFFRTTMNTAKEQITTLETNMNSTSKLKAINLRKDTVKIAKAMFKELVDEPTKLYAADTFLYHHLPNLVELTEKYLDINAHEVKTKNTYEALEKSTEMIDKVSELLLHDYERFVSDDLQELDIELSVAEQNIARNQINSIDETLAQETESDLKEKITKGADEFYDK